MFKSIGLFFGMINKLIGLMASQVDGVDRLSNSGWKAVDVLSEGALESLMNDELIASATRKAELAEATAKAEAILAGMKS